MYLAGTIPGGGHGAWQIHQGVPQLTKERSKCSFQGSRTGVCPAQQCWCYEQLCSSQLTG
jgi:hypothetical protein